MTNGEKWNKFREAAAKLTWAYLATVDKHQPHVRVVHPAFEGEKVWIATGRKSPKARQIEANPQVEMFYAVGEQFTHLTVTGVARFVDDLGEKKRVWNGKAFDYELGQFWPGGPNSPDFGLILVTPAESSSPRCLTWAPARSRWCGRRAEVGNIAGALGPITPAIF